jgi:hypothetical protein
LTETLALAVCMGHGASTPVAAISGWCAVRSRLSVVLVIATVAASTYRDVTAID